CAAASTTARRRCSTATASRSCCSRRPPRPHRPRCCDVRPWTHTSFAQQLVFGAGSLTRVPELLKALGARRVLLVTTKGRNDSDDGSRVRSVLGSALASTFAEVE